MPHDTIVKFGTFYVGFDGSQPVDGVVMIEEEIDLQTLESMFSGLTASIHITHGGQPMLYLTFKQEVTE